MDLTIANILRTLDKELSKNTYQESPEAQELFWEAMDAETEKQAKKMLIQAWQLDPGNLDVVMELMQHTRLISKDEADILERLVKLGEKQLGKSAFKEYAGHFWGWIETRPYMRARQALAEVYHDMLRYGDAAQQYQEMLILNPGDNQGVRYELLAVYLKLKCYPEAEELISRYPGEIEFNTVFAWSIVLLKWIFQDKTQLNSALASARKQNPYTEAFIIGKHRLPHRLPASYQPGKEDEAKSYAHTIRLAWDAHPKAKSWLKNLNKQQL